MRLIRDRSGGDAGDAPQSGAPAERPSLTHTATALGEVSRELLSWLPILRRLAEAEELRDLALGHCSEINGAAVRSIISARRLRDEYFWPAMTENAWSLLLELFAARLEGRRLDAAALSAATQIPLTSCHHWIDWLAGRGMIFRNGAASEEENSPVDLSEAGADEMRAYLLASLRLSPWVQ